MWKWSALCVVLAWASGCGTATPDPDPSCEPRTCDEVGASCGTASDGCGGELECGGCPSGMLCAADNRCAEAPCEPITCEEAGAECGRVGDGCGGVLECGTCGAGETCGGGGAANVCGPSPCTPITCEDAGAQCGSISDGCGDTLQCGQCGEGEACDTSAEPPQCVATCTPTTCEAQGKDCGTIADGCGGTRECGSCPAGQRCGTHSANVCADVAGASRWAETLPGIVVGLDLDDEGNVLAIASRSEGEMPQQVVKFSAAGDRLWEYPLPRGEHRTTHMDQPIAAASHGIYVLHGGTDGAVLLKLRRDGTQQWSRTLGGYPVGVATNEAGAVVAITWESFQTGGQAYRFDEGGTREWVVDVPGVRSVAVDPDGAVILGGTLPPPDDQSGLVSGAGENREPWLMKVAASGEAGWLKVLSGGRGAFTSLGTSALGTVVGRLALAGGTVTWAGQSFSHRSRPHDERRTLLVTAEADGAERWVIEHRYASAARLSVVPRGEVAMLYGVYICTGNLVKYNLVGEELWAEKASENTCEIGAELQGLAVAADGKRTVIGGSFNGTHDFGEGDVTAENRDGFIRVFGP